MTYKQKRYRADDIYEVVKRLAIENGGNTPRLSEVADELNCTKQNVASHYQTLEKQNRMYKKNGHWVLTHSVFYVEQS